MSKKALGRGLGALIGPQSSENKNGREASGEIVHMDIDLLHSNPNQPRKDFCEGGIIELAQSIKENGLIQPIIVRKNGQKYQIVAGERRYRACKTLGMQTIPSIIKKYNDETTSKIALIENIQRQDLSPIEEAKAYRELISNYQLTQAELGETLGKSRSAITNSLRLLELPEEVIKMLNSGTIFMGHARALLSIPEKSKMLSLAYEIEKKGLSVRDTEKKAKQIIEIKRVPEKNKTENLELKRISENLEMILSTKVTIKGNEKNGKIEIDYYNLDELNRIIELLESR